MTQHTSAPLDAALLAPSSSHLARLADVAGDTGCSAFVAFAYLNRLERPSPAAARQISLDRAAVYDWYLRSYAPLQLPHRVPLSGADISWLLEETSLPGIAFSLPRVVSWSALRPHEEGGRYLKSNDEAALAVWWAKVRAPAMGVEDRLIPPRYRELVGLSDRTVAPDLPAPHISAYAADVEIAGPLSRATGLGAAARQTVGLLRQAGLRVKSTDSWAGHTSSADPGYAAPAPIAGAAPATIFYLNPDTLPLAFSRASEPFASRRAGFFFWELNRPATADFLGLDLVDEVWAASAFVQSVYASVFSGPVPCVGMGLAPPPPSDIAMARAKLRTRAGLALDAFVFFAMFDGLSFLARKNPLGVISAFQTAFPGRTDVALVLKGHHRPQGTIGIEVGMWRQVDAAVNADPRIRLIEATLPYAEVMDLLAGADSFVSLHRSEGFGLGPAEAMMRGIPAIVTAYGGTEDFCDDTTALRVPFDTVDVLPDAYLHAEPGHTWAEPKVDAAAAHMRRLRDDSVLRAVVAESGRERTMSQLSIESVAARYVAQLERLIAG